MTNELCVRVVLPTDNLNWKPTAKTKWKIRDGYYTIIVCKTEKIIKRNAYTLVRTYTNTHSNKWISFYYTWWNKKNRILYMLVYSKSIVWIVSSAPLWFWHLLATLIIGIIMHMNVNENMRARKKQTRAYNKFYQPWKSSSSSSSPSWWSLPAPSICTYCVCVRAKKRRPPKRQNRSDSLWLQTIVPLLVQMVIGLAGHG